MTADIVERIRRSARYRDVDAALVERLATEELPKSRNGDEAVKRVKRRLHQAVGAFRGSAPPALTAAWRGDLGDPDFRAACLGAMRSHASTRERIGHIERFFPGIWSITGVPQSVLDLGCGLNPLALPWMALAPDAAYVAIDADERPLAAVRGFLDLVGQPHEVTASDLVTEAPTQRADVALLLKLVTTLDRQDPARRRAPPPRPRRRPRGRQLHDPIPERAPRRHGARLSAPAGSARGRRRARH